MTRDRLDHSNIHNILIRSTNWVGDALLTTPAIRAVRRNFPAASITVLAKPWVAPVFFNNPHIDNISIYDGNGKHKGLTGKFRLAKALRKAKFDGAIIFQNAFEAALLAYLAGIPKRVGYDTDGRGLLLTDAIAVDAYRKQIHETEYYLGILSGAGLRTSGRNLTLVVSDDERSQAGRTLMKYQFEPTDKIIGISPGATYGSAKRWSPGRFAALCDRLCESRGVHIVIFGGPDERAIGEHVRKLMKYTAVNLCGRTNLREAAALTEKCSLFITNDSGLMHIAAALDVPLVAIFGSTNPVTTGPVGINSHIVRVPVPCSPCLKAKCPTDHRCMNEITVDMVYEVVEGILR
ncbi:MAG: lipopolysaccharide heptosyltransferase II [Deltaproteobacteria bacterium]|nr:lipopolysaccharide heptosyltransferase II [Deltaproteobacteria bacterium]